MFKFLILLLLPILSYGQIILPHGDPNHPVTAAHYPLKHRINEHDGKAFVRLFVLSNGYVDKVELIESTGYKGLDKEALKVAKTWRLSPGTIDGKPSDMWVEFIVTFIVTKE